MGEKERSTHYLTPSGWVAGHHKTIYWETHGTEPADALAAFELLEDCGMNYRTADVSRRIITTDEAAYRRAIEAHGEHPKHAWSQDWPAKARAPFPKP